MGQEASEKRVECKNMQATPVAMVADFLLIFRATVGD
jgi:hypothetical protein